MSAEEALVKEIVLGDSGATREFFEVHRSRLWRASRHLFGGKDAEASAIVQETFIIALRRTGSRLVRALPHVWLRRICLSLCYTRLRPRKRVLERLEEDIEVFLWDLEDERPRDGAGGDPKLRRLELLRSLTKRLDANGRKIIELRDVRGMRYAAIGRTLEVPVGTVLSRLARAKGRLRRLVEASLLRGKAPMATFDGPPPEPPYATLPAVLKSRERMLVLRILSGEADAEAEFVAAYRPRLFRISAYFMRDRDFGADEVVLDTFRIAFAGMGRHEFAEPVYVWLRRICLRLCYARLREGGREFSGVDRDLEAFLGGRDSGAGWEYEWYAGESAPSRGSGAPVGRLGG